MQGLALVILIGCIIIGVIKGLCSDNDSAAKNCRYR